MAISGEIRDDLLKGLGRPEDLAGDGGLMKELEIRLMERIPGAGLTAHPGHEAGKKAFAGQCNGSSAKVLKGQERELPVAAPRDRDSSLGSGLVTRDQTHPLDLYGLTVPPDPIGRVTDAVLDRVRKWQSRAPDRMYPIVIFDALRVRHPRCRQPDGDEQGRPCSPRRHPRRPARGSGPVLILAFGDERAEEPRAP